jgi:hypothetical protein
MKPQPVQHVLSHAKALPDKPQPLVKWLDENGNALVGVACVVMIGGAIWFSYHRTTTSRAESAWAHYSMARNAKEFGDIADAYESYDVGAWARLSEGERYLDSGLALMFTDRSAGLGDLEKADEAFQKVLHSASAPTPVRERALWGLAKSTETQSDADTAKAIKAYEALLTQFPKSTYKASAEERIEALKSDSAKEFYAWFHKQKPKPADRSKPQDGLPPGHPAIGTSKDEPSDVEKPADGEKSAPPKVTIPLDPDDDKPAEKKKDDKPKDDSEKPQDDANKPKNESKDAPAESK